MLSERETWGKGRDCVVFPTLGNMLVVFNALISYLFVDGDVFFVAPFVVFTFASV